MLSIVFMGTPDFAIPALNAIAQGNHEIKAVVTQPDKPRGRGRKLTPPPVKKWAMQRNIPVYQPEKVRDKEFVEILQNIAPDIIVTAAFGQILSREVLDLPSLGSINIHASLLPKYRGASPIQHALINGESETGITIMYMEEELDAGDIILQKKIQILAEDNAEDLHDKLAILGGTAIKEALDIFSQGKPAARVQNHKQATYCSKINKAMGEIDWSRGAVEIKNLVRGMTPWPGAYTFVGDRRIKVWRVQEWEYSKTKTKHYGMVVESDQKNGLVVECGNGFLRLETIQRDGASPMEDTAFIRGNPIPVGTVLG